jgi:hypothetical protein
MDSERRSIGKSRRNQNRRENHLEIALRKQRGGKEQRRKGVGDRYNSNYAPRQRRHFFKPRSFIPLKASLLGE